MTQNDVAKVAKSSSKLGLIMKIIGLILGLGIGAWIFFMTPPEGLGVEAIRFLGIFVGAMLLMVFRVHDDWIISMVACILLVLTKVAPFTTVYSPMAGTTIWIIIPAFAIAHVLAKTGLLKRVALNILSWFPGNFGGQITALFVAGTIVSPLIPSTLAKMSIFAPFTEQVADQMGYPKHSKQATGLFLAQWVSAGLLGYGFYSGSFAVGMLLGLCPDADKAYFTWGSWLATNAAWLVVMWVLSFIFIQLVYKPKQKVNLPKGFVKQQVKDLGPMSKDEIKAAVVLVIVLIMWLLEKKIGISACQTAIIGMCIFAVIGMFKKPEVSTAIPWGEIFYMLLFFTVAALIGVVGISGWLQGILDPILRPLFDRPYLLILGICVCTYILRFVILSQFTIATVVVAILGGLAQSVGMNVLLIALVTYVTGNIFVLDFMNSVYVTARVCSHNMVDNKDTMAFSLTWMVINLLGWWASIPLWQALGLM